MSAAPRRVSTARPAEPIPSITFDEALADPQLLGAAFGQLTTWAAWLVILKAAFGLQLSADDLQTFERLAGNRQPPDKRVRELWAIIGRRAGKSRMAAAIAAFFAGIVDHAGKLSPGETGFVLVLAASKLQARVVHAYVRGFFEASPVLCSLIAEVTADEIRLTNGVVVAVHTNSYRTVRGRTLLAVIFDETAFWRDESSTQPDVETYRAVLPALATTGGMLVGISSPYRKTGLLFAKHEQHFGKDDPAVLVIQAAARALNPTLDEAVIEAARSDDPEAARAEWDGEFRTDLAAFVDHRAVVACIETGLFERPPQTQFSYVGFVDVAGGSGTDSMTLGIAHTEGQTRILDLVREVKPPFGPEAVTEEFSDLLKRYRITKVFGDRYAGEWPREQFERHGIYYKHAERTRSQLYLDLLPLLNSRAVKLLDNPRLVSQLTGLERRTMQSGRDAVDHGPGGHDDVANAVAGALCHAPAQEERRYSYRSQKKPAEYADPLADWR